MRVVPPVTAAAPAPAPASVQTAPPTSAPTPVPTAAPTPSGAPYDESSHPLVPEPGALAAGALTPPTGFQAILATTSAGAQTESGRLSLAAAAGFAVAYGAGLALHRRLAPVRA